ncbi:MAG: hypothetical protein H7Y38_16790 [Armatimonadetes bacterium]|nr:hypothetical protein [Armatimonadota bacterium]
MAQINRIGLDKAGRYLVTASLEKTARVWDSRTGALLRVLRPPLGDGDEGKLYAVAITPDGNAVACAGWTSYEWNEKNSIYFFDRATGRLTRRITGLPNVITHLVFSPDGS